MAKSNGLGRYVGLREVEIDPSTNKMEIKNKRTISINENLYLKLKDFSRDNNIETYENAINYLLQFWNNNNK